MTFLNCSGSFDVFLCVEAKISRSCLLLVMWKEFLVLSVLALKSCLELNPASIGVDQAQNMWINSVLTQMPFFLGHTLSSCCCMILIHWCVCKNKNKRWIQKSGRHHEQEMSWKSPSRQRSPHSCSIYPEPGSNWDHCIPYKILRLGDVLFSIISLPKPHVWENNFTKTLPEFHIEMKWTQPFGIKNNLAKCSHSFWILLKILLGTFIA